MKKILPILALTLVFLVSPVSSSAEQDTKQHAATSQRIKDRNPSKSARTNVQNRLSIFSKGFKTTADFKLINLTERLKDEKEKNEEVKQKEEKVLSVEEKGPKLNLEYVSQDPKDTVILPPSENPPVRLNPDAPSSIKAMVHAKRTGDRETAKAYASQYIRYQQNYFFELREMVDLLGQALIEQEVIDEDSWVGVGQMMDYEMAKTRLEMGAVLKPTHDLAMKRIVPDKQNKAEVFYFFSMSCSWCRYMAPDVERLWRLVQNDPNVKMTGVTIGQSSADWIGEYRDYTGATFPIVEGTEFARSMNIGFVPAIVVVAPNGERAYLKTGQQNFERMYEFVRAVQGLPAEITENFVQLASQPVGKVEIAHAKSTGKKIALRDSNGSPPSAASGQIRKVARDGLTKF